jgi:hypothetical protein
MNDLERIIALASQKAAEIAEQASSISREGIAQSGSYNPTEGTVDVIQGDTFNQFLGEGDQPIPHKSVPIVGPMVGWQYGLIGDERVILIPTQGGFVALTHHGEDDSPGAPAGELWVRHRNPAANIGLAATGAPAVYDFAHKLTNDGPTPGDGLAGDVIEGAALHSRTTAGGQTDVFNDTEQTITRTTAAGLQTKLSDADQTITHVAGPVVTIWDAAGRAISHVVPTGGLVGLGALASSLPASGAAINNLHVTEFSGSIMADMMQSFAGVFSTAMATAGIPNAAALEAIVQAAGWVLGNVTPPTIPSGSSLVRIAL